MENLTIWQEVVLLLISSGVLSGLIEAIRQIYSRQKDSHDKAKEAEARKEKELWGILIAQINELQKRLDEVEDDCEEAQKQYRAEYEELYRKYLDALAAQSRGSANE